MTRTGISCDTRTGRGILNLAEFRAWRSLRESNPCLRRGQPKAFEAKGECHLSPENRPQRLNDFRGCDTKMSNIYVISCAGFVKVGKADDVQKRLVSMRTGNPLPCVVEHTSTVERSLAHKAEAIAHSILAEHRRSGEWFDVSVAVAKAAVEHACDVVIPRTSPALTMQEIGVEMARETLTRRKSEVLTEIDRFDYCYTYRTDFHGFSVGPMSRAEASRIVNWKAGEARPTGCLPKMTAKLWKAQQKAKTDWIAADVAQSNAEAELLAPRSLHHGAGR